MKKLSLNNLVALLFFPLRLVIVLSAHYYERFKYRNYGRHTI